MAFELTVLDVVAFAIPKSVTFIFPSLEMMIFCGLISLWMIFAA